MLAKAAAASVLQWLTLPRNYDLQEYQLLLGGQTQVPALSAPPKPYGRPLVYIRAVW